MNVSTPPDSPGTGLRRRRVTSTFAASLLFAAVSVTVAFGFFVVPGTQRFGVGAGQFLTFFTVFGIALFVASPVTGRLMISYGIRRVVIVCSLLMSASLVGVALTSNIVVFLLLAIPFGIGQAGCTVLAASAVVTSWHPEHRRGRVLGLVAMGGSIGGIACGFVFPPVIAAGGYTGGMLLCAAIVFACATVPAVFLLRDAPATAAGEEPVVAAAKTSRRHLFAGYWAIVLLLVAGAVLFAFESAFNNLQAAVYGTSGVPAATAGLLLSYYSICALVAQPILGFLYDKLGIVALFVVLAILYVLGLPMLAVFGGTGLIAYFVVLPIAALSVSTPTVMLPLIIGHIAGAGRFPAIYGVVFGCYALGLGATIPLWGVFFDRTGSYRGAMILAGVLGLLGLGTVIVAYLRGGRRRADATTAEEVASAAEVARG